MEGNDIVFLPFKTPRQIRLTNSVLKEFLAEKHVRMDQMQDCLSDYGNMTELCYLMLKADDPELTREYCDQLLDELKIIDIITGVSEALTAAFDTGEQENPTMMPRISSLGQNN